MRTTLIRLAAAAMVLGIAMHATAARNILHPGAECGLSSNYIMDIAQDRDGYVWISTESGLNRFDGSTFIPFRKGDADGPAANELNRLYADTVANVLWIATQRYGLDRLDCSTYTFTHYNTDPSDPQAICSAGVTDVSPASGGNLWVATYTDGLDLLDTARGTFTHFNSRTIPSWPDDRLWTAEEGPDGKVYAGHVNGGFTVLDPATRTFRNYRHDASDPASLPGNAVKSILTEENGSVWVGTDRGLALFHPSDGTFTIFRHDSGNPTSLAGNIVHDISRTSDGRLWISTEDGGLSILDLRNTVLRAPSAIAFTNIPVRSDDHSGRTPALSNKTVHKVFEDSFGNIWIGTGGDGIDLICHRRLSFDRLHPHSEPVSTSFSAITSLCPAADGSMLAGTDGFGIDVLTPTGRTRSITTANSPLRDNAVLSMFRDSRGRVWCGTYNGGVMILDANTLRGTDATPAKSIDVRSFGETPDGRILAANGMGIIEYTPSGELAATHYTPDGALADEWIRSMLVRADSTIWVGSFGGGISIYDKDFNRLHSTTVWNGLRSNTVHHLLEAPGNKVWAATGDGLVRLHADGSIDTILGAAEGLADANIRALAIDSMGNLWMSTGTGISMLSPEGALSNFGQPDGIDGGDFAGGCVAASPDGRLHFGSHFGLYSFEPQSIVATERTPVPAITRVTVYDSDNRDPATEMLAPPQTIRLPYNRNTLFIGFNVLDPSLASIVNYRYRVDGIDSRWYPGDAATGVALRNLRPGKYKLWVEASLRNRPEIAAVTPVEIIISPPLWATWWAKALYALIAAALLVAGVRFYKKRLALEYELTLERRNSRHEQELNAERMRFFTNITHELRTPLTLILGPLDDLRTDPTLTSGHSRRISVIHKSAERLLELINSILEFRRTETQNRALSVTHADMARTVADIGQKYRELNTNPAVTVETEIEPGDFFMWYDPEVVGMIVDNLMSNACKYTVSGKVTLRLSHTEESGVPFTEIAVADTGIGMSRETLRHIFDRYYRDRSAETRLGTGIGLALVYNLVNLHEGEIFADSEQDRGSVFRFRLHTASTYPAASRRSEEVVAAPAAEPSADNTRDEAAERPTVLVVEDNVDIINYIRESLASLYRVVSATDGADGLEKARKEHPDIIVSDVMMPRMDGMAMIKALKADADTEHIPVIVVTAKIADEARREAYDIGADSFITKPFSAGLLRSRIHNILETRHRLATAHIGAPQPAAPQPAPVPEAPDAEPESPVSEEIVSDMSRRDAEFIAKLEAIVKENMGGENLDVGFIAEAMCMSHSTLYRKVKAVTGLSVAGYIRKSRARAAATLLETGLYTVSEIAFMVGMGSPGNFRQCFREEFGHNPSEHPLK